MRWGRPDYASPDRDPLRIELSRGTEFLGRVQGPSGPVPGAEGAVYRGSIEPEVDVVEEVLTRSLPPITTLGTDARGGFRLRRLDQDRIRLVIRAPGFQPMEWSGAIPDRSAPVKITLERGIVLEGTVVDTLGEPVSGATVRAGEYDSRAQGSAARLGHGWSDESVTRTDGLGRFRLDDLSGERSRLQVPHPEYATEIVHPRDRGPFEITLSRGTIISGTVESSVTGQPVAGSPTRDAGAVRRAAIRS